MTLYETHVSDLARDADRLRLHYHEDGAVIVRGLLRPELRREVLDALEGIETLLEERHNLAPLQPNHLDPVRHASDRLARLDARVPGSQGVAYDAIAQTPAMHAAAADPAVMSAVRAILSPDIAIHPRLILLMSMPSGTWQLAGWHQDFYYNEGPDDTLTLYAPLQRTDAKNGGLVLALGEHRRGLLPHGDHAFPNGRTKWHTLDEATVKSFPHLVERELDAGDALFLHSLLPHAARVNRSDAVRLVVNLRYRDLRHAGYREADWRIPEIGHARRALARTTDPVATTTKETTA